MRHGQGAARVTALDSISLRTLETRRKKNREKKNNLRITQQMEAQE